MMQSRAVMLLRVISISVLLLGWNTTVAQTTGTTQSSEADSTRIPATAAATNDSTRVPAAVADSVTTEQPRPVRDGASADNVSRNNPDGDGVKFSAADSLTFRARRGQREARLYGSARVEHPSGQLTAGMITLNLDEHIMSATTATPGDTLSEPVLQRDEDTIRSHRILFNYKTEKGKFEVARIRVDNANVTGNEVKRTAPHVIFIRDGIYSTCTLDHPHYYLRAARMKMVDEDEIFFTRARLYILDIPYPFVFPFGFVPSQFKRNRSGVLEPTYSFQDQNNRGLGLQNLGWFQYFNDNITGTFSGDIFTSGTYYLNSQAQYNKIGQYSGSVRVEYSLDRGMEATDPDFTESATRALSIQHNQTLSPYASLNASINLRTSQFFIRNSLSIEDRANTSTTSRIGYNFRQPDGVYTFGANITQNQNFLNNTVSLNGPSTSFSLRRQTPFQQQGAGSTAARGKRPWYETLSLGYSNRFNSRFDFNPLTNADPDISWIDALFSPAQYRQATGRDGHVNYGLNHQADATAQLIPSDYANLTATVRLNEYWYPETIRQVFNPELNRTETQIQKGFAAARDFSTSLSLGTTIYGISMQKIGSFEGFRHTMRPAVSYNYRPDFGSSRWGYFRTTPVDTLGNTRKYSIFERGIFGGPGAGEQQSISFTLDNVFETKQVQRDTTGQRREQIVRLIDNLRGSLSYNFAAQQFKLSDLNTSMNTSFVKGVSINANATFSFYDTDSLGRAIPQYLWDNGNGFIRPMRFAVRASTQFQSGRSGMQPVPRQYYHPRHYDPFNQAEFDAYDQMFNNGPLQPIDVSWAFSLSLSYDWQRVGTTTRKSAVLNANDIQFRITPEWQVATSMGYDFIAKELTPTRFAVTRNLHCWDMSFDWNPFGDFKYYMFRLSVRDPQIQGLFQKLPGLNNLQRSSSPINRPGYY